MYYVDGLGLKLQRREGVEVNMYISVRKFVIAKDFYCKNLKALDREINFKC